MSTNENTNGYSMILSPILHGFALGTGLIIAIGPQNTFVISQGIKREHVLLSVLICILTDTLLITLGVVGLGELFNLHPIFSSISRWFGATFLITYALFAFHAAINPKSLDHNNLDKKTHDSKQIVMILLCLGLLNPHAYLDTVVLLGSIAAQNPGITKYLFGIGAILASAFWFTSIGFAAKLLTPVFEKKNAWRILDLFMGITMLFIALILIGAKKGALPHN